MFSAEKKCIVRISSGHEGGGELDKFAKPNSFITFLGAKHTLLYLLRSVFIIYTRKYKIKVHRHITIRPGSMVQDVKNSVRNGYELRQFNNTYPLELKRCRSTCKRYGKIPLYAVTVNNNIGDSSSDARRDIIINTTTVIAGVRSAGILWRERGERDAWIFFRWQ